jgi:hypothetical protein
MRIQTLPASAFEEPAQMRHGFESAAIVNNIPIRDSTLK